MTITTLADGTFEFKEVYNAINLKSANGEQFSICMRDTGFEFTYEGKTFVAKNKLLGPTKQVKTNISESNVSGVANNLSKDLVTNTQCIILLTQLLQLLRKQFKALYTELAIPYMLSKDKNFKGTSPYSNTFSTNTITVTLKTK